MPSAPSPGEVIHANRHKNPWGWVGGGRTLDGWPILSIDFNAKNSRDPNRSRVGLEVASTVLRKLTQELFTDDQGSPALHAVHGPSFPVLPVLQCTYPGPELPPRSIRIYRKRGDASVTHPEEFAASLADNVGQVLKHTRYFDPHLRLYTGGDRFMSHLMLVGYLARQATFVSEEIPPPENLAEQFALIGTTVAWAVFEPLVFNVYGGGPTRRR